MTTREKFRELLRLQKEIEERRDQFIDLVKSIEERNERRVIAEIDGEIFELRKLGEQEQIMGLCRKHKGFFHDYRVICLGPPQ